MHEATTLEEAARALLETTRPVIACDHCGYQDVDEHHLRLMYRPELNRSYARDTFRAMTPVR